MNNVRTVDGIMQLHDHTQSDHLYNFTYHFVMCIFKTLMSINFEPCFVSLKHNKYALNFYEKSDPDMS